MSSFKYLFVIAAPASVVIIILLMSSNNANAQMHYRYRAPMYIPTQHFIAVPGRIIQHGTENSIAAPSVPFQIAPLVHSYYELETDSSSSPPPDDDDEILMPDVPMSPPPQPPMESHPEPPPMMTPPPPPPDNNDHFEMKPSHSAVIHKHVSVHIPPKEFEEDDEQIKVIRPLPSQENRINIVFIKLPSPSNKRKTEVILPKNPEQKTLIYVLVKKPDPAESIRVRGPPPSPRTKPQVFFIRYKPDKPEEKYYHEK